MPVLHNAGLHLGVYIELFVFRSLNVSMHVAEPIPLAVATIINFVCIYARDIFKNTDLERSLWIDWAVQWTFQNGPKAANTSSLGHTPIPEVALLHLLLSPLSAASVHCFKITYIFLPHTHCVKEPIHPRAVDMLVSSLCPSGCWRFRLPAPGPSPYSG